jgi:general secretion pathway protein C
MIIRTMPARLTAFVVWGLVAATGVFWGLRLFVRPQPAPAYALAVGEGVAVRGDLSRLFGAAPVVAANTPAAPELASRFKLIGVMASKETTAAAPGPGYALIVVDGKPARAFAVGAPLDTGLVLKSVSLRTASIGPLSGATMVKLELPPLPAPATGTLPPIGESSTAAPAPAATPPPPAQPRPAAQPRQPLTARPPGQTVPPPPGTPPRTLTQ